MPEQYSTVHVQCFLGATAAATRSAQIAVLNVCDPRHYSKNEMPIYDFVMHLLHIGDACLAATRSTSSLFSERMAFATL